MRLGRTFFSLYFLIISTFIFLSWVTDEVWRSYLEQDIESYTGYKTMLSAIGDYIEKHPRHEWQDIIKNAGSRYELPLSLIPLAEVRNMDSEEKNELHHGNTHVYYANDRVEIHHLLESSDMVITLGPAKMPTRPRQEAFMRVLVLALLAIVVFIWVRPLSRDLDQLQKSARLFGKGDFDSKAPDTGTVTISPLFKTFNMMADRIKRLIEAHKELTNAVAHELRTPLARSKFALQMLSRVKDEEKKETYLKQISGDVAELEELVNEMLVYSSFESDKPKLDIEEYSLSDLVAGHLQNHQQYAGEITTEITGDNLLVECDRHFIDRALHNYISNAVKYGKDRVHIAASSDGKQCQITVEDNGEGVSDEFKAVIFDAFSRGDQSRNRETGGFGLGLAIVSRIMEWHKGQAKIADSALGGAKFILNWPVKQQ